MDFAREVRAYESRENIISLMAGSPGPETLKDCKEILLKATSYMLDHETDTTHMFCYGPDMGDLEFRQELAKFLSQEYGSPVTSSSLMVTAGATQALHMIATVLFSQDCVVFVEDPTYFAACRVFKDDLQMNLVPVPCDADGMDTDVLERLLAEHSGKRRETNPAKPFWGLVYTIPVYNNPTGNCYKPSRCRRLVELARKHDVLLLAEDIYNLIHFGDSSPPPRLLTYDDPADPEYRGHVISSGSFSKILAPGLRLGWVEAPPRVLSLLVGSNIIWSGGSLNHYASKLAGAIISMGLEAKHLSYVRQVYKKRNDAVCDVLTKHLPKGATFQKPEGGFFVWIVFPEHIDTLEMMKWIAEKHNLFYLPGACASVEGKFGNCARIGISFHQEDILVDAVRRMCQGATEFLSLHTTSS